MPDNSIFLKYLEHLSITAPTKIQNLCFQPIFEGKSVFALAPTGSGKTLGFVLPLFLKIDTNDRNTTVLILVPTRELGNQIAQVCEQLSKIIMKEDQKNVLVRSAFGGSPISKQLIEIAKKPHILIATPGRMADILERNVLDTKKIETLILDEADIMVGMGFSDQVQTVYEALPKKLQVGLFSATQSEKVTTLEKVLLKNKEHVVCNALNVSDENKSDHQFHDSPILHQYIISSFDNKYEDLVSFLKDFESKNSQNSGKVILFCREKETANELADAFKEDGLLADTLTGDHGQIHRNSVMRHFKTGNLKYLVATNIAARGIDIDKLAAVIHFDIPLNTEEYIHRTGRTGRSGFSEGVSLTFCNAKNKGSYLKMMEDLEISTQEFKLPSSFSQSKNNKASASSGISKQTPSPKIEFIKIHLNKGKKNKIRPGDILGAFIQELKLTKEDIGGIFIFDNFTHVEINVSKKMLVLNGILKIKNLAVKATSAT